MILSLLYRTPEQAVKEFRAMGRDCLIMPIVAYADESGTHDRIGQLPSSDCVILAGIAAPKEYWAGFCGRWQSVLNKYNYSFFHFNERKSGEGVPDPFLMELTALIEADDDKIIFGGFANTRMIHELKTNGEIPSTIDAFGECAISFFENYIEVLAEKKPHWRYESVEFIFDRTDDKGWKRNIREGFEEVAKARIELRAMTYAKKTDEIPIQAADLLAYWMRRRLSETKTGEIQHKEHRTGLDDVLMRMINRPW